ncbi:hypothetical protein ACQYAD_12290 [Neobacillus sp. SM06]|uniref:hypothetical protein n=1 Tax=Neobacillus sp. SM06 TaxID=3422492 RepID=UPI003D2CEAB2
MDYVSFGTITIPVKWLSLIAALLLSFLILKLHKKPPFSSIVYDSISNGLLVGVAVLKLSLFLIEPSLVIEHPLSLLYFTGGDFGYWLAIACASGYFFWETKRKRVLIRERIAAFFYYVLYSYSIFHLTSLFFRPEWESIFSLVFSAVVLVWFFVLKKGTPFYSFAIGFALYQLILLNLFQQPGKNSSYEYSFYAILIVLLLFLKKSFRQ